MSEESGTSDEQFAPEPNYGPWGKDPEATLEQFRARMRAQGVTFNRKQPGSSSSELLVATFVPRRPEPPREPEDSQPE